MPSSPLAGQSTLLSCWDALAATAMGPGRLVYGPHATAAVFPRSAFFNNAILTGGLDSLLRAVEFAARTYGDAGIAGWALWVPSDVVTLDGGDDRVPAVPTLTRDVTTLVMSRPLGPGLRPDDRVTTISGAALHRLVLDEAVAPHELGRPADAEEVVGWALVAEGQVVASAFTHVHGGDCGIYAVETRPEWRRRGFARALVRTILAAAHARGLRTASLQSTPMAEPLYRGLGFRPAGRYEEWTGQGTA